ncbi:MAG: cryptochrome/photolyase family protein [Armatimonadetes bacterium]|nr:cryptochrome/photolyase family protein [Anaerolineae bacterium]
MTKTTVWILGDQLLRAHPALIQAQTEKEDITVLLVWNQQRNRRIPYHRQKLVLLLSAMRHFAEYLREQAITVDFVTSDSLTAALHDHAQRHTPDRWLTMAASEYRGRMFQESRMAAVVGVPVTVLPNTQFLIGQYDPYPQPTKKVVMEYFYRAMRKHFNVLMDDANTPTGGEWNYDHDNRKPLPKRAIRLPDAPSFAPDALTQRVMGEIAAQPSGVGSVDGFGYAVTHAQAAAALDDFIAHRLPDFGAYEDAMTSTHRTLYHSVLSPYLNIGLLEPLQLVEAAVEAYRAGMAPLNSVEGFVRQIIGWREYIAWQYWAQMPDLLTANSWGAQRDVPRFFWTGATDMNCLKHVLEGVLATGYSHHIERLMVISNYFMLAGVHPQAAVAWFSALYIDAYDWVMQPNVVGMGLNADGGRTATKPYIASANYINKMSDYCGGCRFNPKQRTGADACPFNYLYWNFLIDHEAELRANPRLGPAVLGLRHLDDAERAAVQAQAAAYLDELNE